MYGGISARIKRNVRTLVFRRYKHLVINRLLATEVKGCKLARTPKERTNHHQE